MPCQDAGRAGRASDSTAPTMVGVSLGGSFPQGVPAPGALLDPARHAEASGFDAVWSGDHVMMCSPIVECVTLLSAPAGRAYLLHLSHYDPAWWKRKTRERRFSLDLAFDAVDAMADAGRLDLVDDPIPVAGRLDRHRRSAITAAEKLRLRTAFMLDPLLADQSASSRATEASV